MNPVLLQKQLKDNAADFNDFYKELKAWGDDMKRKEDSLKSNNNVPTSEKKNENLPKKKKKVEFKQPETVKVKSGVTNYAAWDNFDADAECEKLDYNENESSDLTDECDETVIDKAYLEKEKGNKFVKDKKWDEAIKCYNKAISYYAYDPIFYANRALCFLKTGKVVEAEADCTMSLTLDATYVKALQRRAACREALGNLSEAEGDLLKVLEFEPNNKETRSHLEALRKKLINQKPVEKPHPVSKFTASRNIKRNQISSYGTKEIESPTLNSQTFNNVSADHIIPVKAVMKPAHLQSKKPLKRIEIKEVVAIGENHKLDTTQSFPQPASSPVTIRTDDLKIIEKQPSQMKENKNQINMKINETQQFSVPVNSVQFYSQWRQFKTMEKKYDYLKLIKPECLPTIFQESLESNVFSEIVAILAQSFIKDGLRIFDFLKFFPEVRRFSTLILFMTDTDKNYLRKLFDYVQQQEKHPKEEIDHLLKQYEM